LDVLFQISERDLNLETSLGAKWVGHDDLVRGGNVGLCGEVGFLQNLKDAVVCFWSPFRRLGFCTCCAAKSLAPSCCLPPQ